MWCHLRSARGSYTRGQRFKHQMALVQTPEVQSPEVGGLRSRCKHQRSGARGSSAGGRSAAQATSLAKGLFACGPYIFSRRPLASGTKAFGLCFFYHAFPSLPVHPRSFPSPPIHPLFISFPSISPSFISCTNMLLIALYIYIYILLSFFRKKLFHLLSQKFSLLFFQISDTWTFEKCTEEAKGCAICFGIFDKHGRSQGYAICFDNGKWQWRF